MCVRGASQAHVIKLMNMCTDLVGEHTDVQTWYVPHELKYYIVTRVLSCKYIVLH